MAPMPLWLSATRLLTPDACFRVFWRTHATIARVLDEFINKGSLQISQPS